MSFLMFENVLFGFPILFLNFRWWFGISCKFVSSLLMSTKRCIYACNWCKFCFFILCKPNPHVSTKQNMKQHVNMQPQILNPIIVFVSFFAWHVFMFWVEWFPHVCCNEHGGLDVSCVILKLPSSVWSWNCLCGMVDVFFSGMETRGIVISFFWDPWKFSNIVRKHFWDKQSMTWFHAKTLPNVLWCHLETYSRQTKKWHGMM